jgi:hypothetical protein
LRLNIAGLDAADIIIDYELARGAAANVPPEQLARLCLSILSRVDASNEAPEVLKFRALKGDRAD